MAVDNDGLTRPCALVVGGDRRIQMLAHVLLAELGYAVSVAPTLASISSTAAPDRVRALVVIQTGSHSRTSPTRLIMGLRQRGYRAPIVILCTSPNERLRQHAFLLGVRDVISLPAREHEVAVRVRFALAASSGDERAHLRVVRPDA